ncbi:MAG: M20/M25/M40 family metallo-hydrolase, partial [Candidatus Omnitrophica bacterium]|nr:M20/M25/M40 family metallo-hydrolase [Candidatus Omnitrophota bacterium]
VPDISAFSIDRRLLPEETVADVKRELQAIIDKLKKKDKDLKVRFKVLAQEPAVVSKRDSHFFKLFSDAVKKVNGKRAKFAMLTGATDMRFLIRKGMPCVGYSIDGDDTCHGDDEYIRIKSLVDTAKVFALFLTRS